MKKIKILFLTLNLFFSLNKFISAMQEDDINTPIPESLENSFFKTLEQQSLDENLYEINSNFFEENSINPDYLTFFNDSKYKNINYFSNVNNDLISKSKNLNKMLLSAINNLRKTYYKYIAKQNNNNKKDLEEKEKTFLDVYNKTYALWEETLEIRKKILTDIAEYKNYNTEILEKHKHIKNKQQSDRHHCIISKEFTATDKIDLINKLQNFCLDIITVNYILHYINPLFQTKDFVFNNKMLKNLNCFGYKSFFKEYTNTLKTTHMFAMLMMKDKKRLHKSLISNKKICFKDSENIFKYDIEKYNKNLLDYVNKSNENFDYILNEKKNLEDNIENIQNICEVNKKSVENFKNCNFIILNLKILKDILYYNTLKIKQIDYSLKKEIKKFNNNEKKNMLEEYLKIENMKNFEKENENFNIFLEQILKEQEKTNIITNKKKYCSIKNIAPPIKNQNEETNLAISPNIENLVRIFNCYKNENAKHKYIKLLNCYFEDFKQEFLNVANIWNLNSQIRNDLKKDIQEYKKNRIDTIKKYNTAFNKTTGTIHTYFNSKIFTAKDKLELINIKQKHYIDIIKNNYILHKVEQFFNGCNKYKNKLIEIATYKKFNKNFNWNALNNLLKEFNWMRKNTYFFGLKNTDEQETYKRYFTRIKRQQIKNNKDIEKYFELVNENFNEIYNEKANLKKHINEIKEIKNLEDKNHTFSYENYNILVFNLEILKNILEYSNLKIQQIESDIKKNKHLQQFTCYKKYKKENKDFEKYINEIFKRSQKNNKYLNFQKPSIFEKLESAFFEYTTSKNKKQKIKSFQTELKNFEYEYLKIKNYFNDALTIRQNIADNINSYNSMPKITHNQFASADFTAKDKVELINNIQKHYLNILKICFAIYDASNFFKYYDKNKEKVKNLINKIKNETNYLKNFKFNDLDNISYNYNIIKKTIYYFAIKIINFQQEKENLLTISKKNIFKKNEIKNIQNFKEYFNLNKENQDYIYNQINKLKMYKKDLNQIQNIYEEKHIENFENCNFLVLILNILKNLLECSNLKFTQISDSIEIENFKLQKNKKENLKLQYINPYKQKNMQAIKTINKIFKNLNNVKQYLTLREKYKFKISKTKNNDLKNLDFLNQKRYIKSKTKALKKQKTINLEKDKKDKYNENSNINIDEDSYEYEKSNTYSENNSFVDNYSSNEE